MINISLLPSMVLNANGRKIFFFLAFILFSVNGLTQISEPTELEKVESHISAIRTKIAAVKADPAENSGASTSGWYDQMNAELSVLFDKKRNLIYNQTGKKWVSIEEFEGTIEKKKQILLNDANYIIEQN